MKLKNKKTGEIGWLYCDHISIPKKMTVFAEDRNLSANHWDYGSLAELNAEWEDAPGEPKEHWAIDQFGEPINVSGLSRLQLEKLHRLGNDFPSENATMKALEKLKAWKRLKDKGFRFEGFGDRDRGYIDEITIYAKLDNPGDYAKDLELLFCTEGGEE